MATAVEPPIQRLPKVARRGLNGLAWGYRFSRTGAAEVLDGAEWLGALERKDVWIWLNFDL